MSRRLALYGARQPGLVRWIEAPRCNEAKLIGAGLFAVFTIDVEQKVDRRFRTRIRVPAPAAQHLRECCLDHLNPARAKARKLIEASVVGRDLQSFKCIDVKFFDDPYG